ncbi:MAG: leucine-rich repeat protein [Clostridia bacterium]|nr:leucine-rich repeat protein [Clostridia bacterium]
MSENKKTDVQLEEVRLEIPEEDIWTYKIDGLAAPKIGVTPKHYNLKKVIFVLVIVVAVALSCFFSVLALMKDTFEYEQVDGGYKFTRFSNTGYIKELEIDYVLDVKYELGNSDPNKNFTIVKDESKPIVEVGSYVLNCDEKVEKITIGAGVKKIDPKAFYSCWALQEVRVDENNPYYCDVDGVLYNKDKTVLIFRPCDHDTYLAKKYKLDEWDSDGASKWRKEIEPDDPRYAQYEKDVMTFVVPSSVKTIGEMAFNYANMKNVYLPEGLEKIETLAFFKIPPLKNVYTYKGENVTDSHFTGEDVLGEVYLSLPEGLKYIGSDAFSYNREMEYLYIPESVEYIGHHAFWDTVFKEDGELKGVSQICVASASEEEFESKVQLGENWKPKYDWLLFKKNVDVLYGQQRQAK